MADEIGNVSRASCRGFDHTKQFVLFVLGVEMKEMLQRENTN